MGESLLLGTGNSGGATHITNQDTAQNQYWQDASQNKQAFINEGTYDPTQQTGRATAQIMEAPNYHPDGSSSYMRMGDPIQNDSSYPSQAGESGMFMATTGHYQEEHQGGMLQMAGNAGTDPSNPIPVSREMTQLNPVGTPNILQSSTANLHNNLMTTSTVNYTNELTEGTLTEALTSPSLFNSWTTDNTSQIFVNQDLQQTGDTTSLTLNNQNTMLTTPANNITQVGTQRTDQITNSSITQNHSNNVLQYQTWEKSTTTGQEQITTQNVNVPNLTRNTQNGTVQAANFNTTASSFSSATSTTYISSLVMNGSSSGSGPSPLMQSHQATLAQQNQQQAQLKKEIVWGLIDPQKCVTNPPQLSVNQQPAKILAINAPTIYELSTQNYKNGPWSLLWQGEEGTVETIIHPQIRHLNLQDPNAKVQLNKPYFNSQGQLSAVVSVEQTMSGGAYVKDLTTIAVMAVAPEIAPLTLADGFNDINSLDETALNWLADTVSFFYEHDSVQEAIAEIGQLVNSDQKLRILKDVFLGKTQFYLKKGLLNGKDYIVFQGIREARDGVTGVRYSLNGSNMKIFRFAAEALEPYKGNNAEEAASVTEKSFDMAKSAVKDSCVGIYISEAVTLLEYLLNTDHDTHEFSEMLTDLIFNPGNIIAGSIMAKGIVKFVLTMILKNPMLRKILFGGAVVIGADGPDEIVSAVGATVTTVIAIGEITVGLVATSLLGTVEADEKITASMTDGLNKAINFMQQYDPHLANEMQQKGPGLIQDIVGVTNKISNIL